MILDFGVVGSTAVVVEYSVSEKFVILGVCGVVVPLAMIGVCLGVLGDEASVASILWRRSLEECL